MAYSVASLALVIFFTLLVSHAAGDVYLLSPRGSNNRLDEARRDRSNSNRLFDSQNNNRGGHNAASFQLLEGEVVPVTFLVGHGLGGYPEVPFNEVIIQLLCDSSLRDGNTADRIPNVDISTIDLKYGQHER